MRLVEVIILADKEGHRSPEVLHAGVLFQAGPDRVAFSHIDSRQATGFALADEYIDPRASELRPAPGVDKQGAGTNDTQSRPVGLFNEAEAVGEEYANTVCLGRTGKQSFR